jgi:UDP-2,4-diacetamido-2,4,6-trideoxy-beta-L-altropyranose hydrolase
MGGVDRENYASKILHALKGSRLPTGCTCIVLLGRSSHWRGEIESIIPSMPFRVKIIEWAENMPSLMTLSDLAIGAAGSTSWERCCVGLPSLSIVVAQNQEISAGNLQKYGATKIISQRNNFDNEIKNCINLFVDCPSYLSKMSEMAANLVDGKGGQRVIETFLGLN